MINRNVTDPRNGPETFFIKIKRRKLTIQEKLDLQKGVNKPIIASQGAISERVRKQLIIGRNRVPITSAQGALSEKVRKNLVFIKGL